MKPLDVSYHHPKASDLGAKRPARLPPSGRYAVEVPPSRVTPFKTSKTRGVLCVVRIIQGPHAGRTSRSAFCSRGRGTSSNATWAFWRNGAGLLEPRLPAIPPA